MNKRSGYPSITSTISSCCLRRGLTAAWMPPRLASGSWRGPAVARDRTPGAAGQADSDPAAGRAAAQHPSAGDRRPRPRLGPARRNSGQGTRWHQPAGMSSRREPHFSSHRVLNADTMPLAATPTGRADPISLVGRRPGAARRRPGGGAGSIPRLRQHWPRRAAAVALRRQSVSARTTAPSSGRRSTLPVLIVPVMKASSSGHQNAKAPQTPWWPITCAAGNR